MKTRLSVAALVVVHVVIHCTSIEASDRALKGELTLRPGVTLRLVASPFDASKHSLKKCQIADWSAVCLIDGKPVFGTDWDIPTTRLESASINFEGQDIPLDTSCMYNPWSTTPMKSRFSIEEREGGFLVRGSFSGGAGTYVAEWFVVGGSSVRALLTDEEELMEHRKKETESK